MLKTIRTICLVYLIAAPAVAQETVFIIRHAEKELSGDDPALTEAGRLRAAAWAEMLGSAGIGMIVTSDTRRARETGGLIANILAVPVTEHDWRDTAGLIDILGFDHEDDIVLVVAHTETIPGILSMLGVSDPPEIPKDDFANLFVVRPVGGDTAALTHLRVP
ncbi:histidine phosphatase family protein [Defluviimonas sp. WL0050]|uniref:Histidine phosphatase family protein n=1 Tax=Albidovulum litorale TaxID=2984134 RepID=A0ABT2ZPM4_9RHOB|nr:phosphoglycerate mutase family protein [Defluviimonas sp. WL0050]MCV2872701.1 histidine phosphatase family protein [Defluviimonas sp. WL0050]